MSSAMTAVPTGLPAAPKPPKKAKRRSVSALIMKAVAASSERGGLSLVRLKNILKAGGYNVVKNNAKILAAVKRLVSKGLLVQTRGSFKLGKKRTKPRRKKVVKKPKAKKVKKPGKKKAASASGKKSPKKKTAKSPKKAKKSPAAKKAKKPSPKKKAPKKTLKKSPKKAKPTRTRAAAAKK